MAVPYTFGSATSAIPLSQLDSNFATTITLGNTAIQLGNTVTTLNNMTLANVTVTTVSGASANAVVYTNSSGQVTANSSVIALDTSGNLGLGVSPSAWGGYATYGIRAFDIGAYGAIENLNSVGGVNFLANAYNNGSNYIYKSSYYATKYSQGNGAHSWYTAASGNVATTITFTQAMTLAASGGLSVGTTTDAGTGNILVPADGKIQGNAASGSGSSSYIELYNSGTGNMTLATRFSTSSITFATGSTPTERARIDSSGNLLVGTTSSSAVTTGGIILNMGGGESYTMAGHKTGTASGSYFHACYYNNTLCGGLTQSGTTGVVLTSISDYRLKEDVLPMQDSLSKVMALNPVSYKWKSDGSDGEGFIAHELQAVIPTAATGTQDEVDEEGNAKYQGINLSALVPHLVKAIQELNAKFEEYKAAHP